MHLEFFGKKYKILGINHENKKYNATFCIVNIALHKTACPIQNLRMISRKKCYGYEITSELEKVADSYCERKHDLSASAQAFEG